ncbi:MAG: hypothetical protein ABSH20_24415 [Tepidisphaeraceae bacterium]|jgi:hypothetical protein
MSTDLYFIAYLCRGLGRLGAKDPSAELRPQLEEIVRLGQQPAYAQGYREFLQFLAAVRAEVESMARHRQEPLFERPPLAAIHAALAAPPSPRIRIERDGNLIRACGLEELPCNVPNITPGRYRILLDTGWVFWEAQLHARHVLWTMAFGDRPLAAAATTELTPASISYHADLQGRLKLTITPGLESGVLTLTLTRR